MKKNVSARRYRCQGLVALGKCKHKALIETTTTLTNGEFGVPIKVKLCMPCSLNFNVLFPKLMDVDKSPFHPKPCGDIRPTSKAGGYICALLAGHAGDHRGQGSTWGRVH